MRRIIALGAILALAFALAACGKKGDDAQKGAEKKQGEKVEEPKEKTGDKTEKTAEPKVEEKAEAKVEEKAEPKAEEKAEPKVEEKAEPKVEEKAEAKTEEKAEAKTEEKAPDAVKTLADQAKAAADQAKDVADTAKALADTEAPALTAEQYEKLVLALETCELKGANIDWKCEAMKKLNEARKAKTALKDLGGLMAGIGKKHLTHESPAVRLKSVQLMSSFFGAGDETRKIVLEGIDKEEHPAVVKAMVGVVGSSGSKSPEVAALLLRLADHKEPMVRKECISWLSTSFSKKVEGRVEKLIEKMEKDADMDVRAYACEVAGKIGDDRLIPVYEKLTADANEKKLYSKCMEGLLLTFFAYPFYDTFSQKGYELMLKRLADTPRDENRPPWTLTGDFKYYAKTNIRGLTEWKKQATWFEPKKVMAPLGDIVKDEAANWMARTAAIDSLVGLGMPKAELEALQKACEGKCKSHVLDKLKKAVAAAK